MFLEWVGMGNLARDNQALNEFKTLLNAFKSDPDKWKHIYTYDTLNNGWYYLDGEKKLPYIKRNK